MTLNSSGLFLEIRRIAYRNARRPRIRARTRGRLSISTVNPPLTRPVMMPMTISFVFRTRSPDESRFAPRLAFSRDRRVSARAILHAVQGNLDGLSDDNLDLALFILELVRRYHGLGLQSNIDDDVVLADSRSSVEDGARTNALARDALFETVPQNFLSCFLLTTL